MSTSPRALIYLRVSTDKQANKGVSLPTQEERCLGRAIDAGYVVEPKHDIYLEPGETGTNMKRPALMDLLARCKEDKSVRAVIIYDLSRLARDRIDFALIKHTLRKARISLLSVTEPIDDTPEGQMLEGVLSTVAEFYSAQSGRKVRDSMRHKAEVGCWPNKAPYGYVNRKEELPGGQVRAWIEPNPEEVRWVQEAFERFATGSYSVQALTALLNREGFKARSMKGRKTKVLHHTQLERLLCNKIYIGVIEWGDILNENGTHERLIEPDLFYRVQDLLLMRSGTVTRVRRHRSLFKRVAVCDECGSFMTIDLKETSSTHRIYYLRCRKVQRGKPVRCAQRYFAEPVYVEQLERLIQRVEFPEHTISLLRDKLRQLSGEEERIYNRLRSDLLKELEVVERRQQNLLVRSLDDDQHDHASRSLYERVRAELSAEHERLTQELGRLGLKLERIGRVLAMALEIAGSATRAFEADDDPDYRGLIARVLFKEVRMRDGNIVGGTLTDPLAVFRKWNGEKPLERLADLGLLCAHNSTLIDGCKKQPQRQVSLSTIRRDLIHLEKILTPEQEADIELCYRELRGRNLLT